MNLTHILLIICVAFCIIMFIYLRWYIKRRTNASGVLNETRVEIKKWINEVNLSIAEINDVTDRNLLLIEDKIKKLNELLEDVDKRIKVYVKEIEKSHTSEALYTQLGRGVRAAIKENVSPSPIITPVTLAPPPLSSTTAPTPSVQQNLALETTPVKAPVSKKQIRSQIDKLANEGLPAAEIAKQLGISIAEVDLAIRLRRG